MGPYLVGFDTLAHYLPTTMHWMRGDVTFVGFIATAPLLYVFSTGLSYALGSVVLALKVLSPLLLGFLGLSSYLFARRGLGWSQIKSLAPALLGTLYFVALRISWDALREEVAVIFLFLALTLLLQAQAKHSWKNTLLFSLALLAVVLSNQVVAVLALAVVFFSLIYMFLRGNRSASLRLGAFMLPSILFFLAVFFFSPAVPEYRLIFGFPSSPDGWLALFGYASYPEMLGSEAIFLLFCFLPLLPLAVLSIRRFQNFQMQAWAIVVLAAFFIPMVSPSNLRLLMLLVYPLAFYVTDALSLLKTRRFWRFKGSLMRVGLVYLAVVTAVFSLGFMVLPPETPFTYFSSGSGFNSHIYQIPSSMLQNTVSISDCPGAADAVHWLKTNMGEGDVLLTHRAFYGWALTELSPDQVHLYEYDNPADVAPSVADTQSGKVFLIWWVPNEGWYGLPSVPPMFSEVYRSGDIAVYTYTP
ncbi:MAG: hypothetical protein NWE93_14565 [Candidatus Bathyarchaeota archaeon]|nr:hypothetical protein [Candidatus Bathyarchaeota archaeon]